MEGAKTGEKGEVKEKTSEVKNVEEKKVGDEAEGEEGEKKEDEKNDEVETDHVQHECYNKCNLRKHASSLTAVLTRDDYSDEKIVSYWKWCCMRYSEAIDVSGRSLLHVAAAKGRLNLLEYLLKHKNIDLQVKDVESHFTPLHCSVFYGHIDCAVRLIQAGAKIDSYDLDELTPLDHISVDKPFNPRDIEGGHHDIFVWGSNTNYTLGIGNQQLKEHPEPMEELGKQRILFKQVVLSTYHSAFLARDGRLWMCGYGDGGRLGFNKEGPVKLPRLVDFNSTNLECISVALGLNHTVVVLGDKTVWSFGDNTYHQLGHDPPPEIVFDPKLIKGLRHVCILGVCASNCHSVFWTENRLYSCGLNGGQLGHTRDAGRTVVVPKAVSGLRQCGIKAVTCSYGATVLANGYGEIYLFYDYVCRKITSRPFYPKMLRALGGHLDFRLGNQHVHKESEQELQVLVVTTCNNIYIWKESDRKYKKYDLNFHHRIVNIVDVAFHDNFVMIASRDGKAYYGDIVGRRNSGTEVNATNAKSVIQLTRISYVHRAVMVSSDPLGRNFAIIQYQPKAKLYTFPRSAYAEVDEHLKNLYKLLDRCNYFQDVVFEVKGCFFHAHRYIVGHASSVLEDMMNKAANPDGTCVVRIDSVGPQIFRALLCFIYTRDFSLLTPYGPMSRKSGNEFYFDDFRVPFEYNGKKYGPIKEKKMSGKEKSLYMKLLEKAAHLFGVECLIEEFAGDNVLYKQARIFPFSFVKFDRERLPYLYDIILKSHDGTVIHAHKCILVARLEYFNCMMNNKCWLESTQEGGIELPIPGQVLTILIDYLYTGSAPVIVKTDDTDLVFVTLVTADQLFCNGLKHICEYTLSQLMSLNNASDILQVGLTFNADELKRFAMEFICQNLGYILETKSLEELSNQALRELAAFYRARVPLMSTRRVSAFCNAPDDKLVSLIFKTEPADLKDFDEVVRPKSLPSSPKKMKKEKKTIPFLSERSRSLDSLLKTVDLIDRVVDPESNEEVKYNAPWVTVVKHPTRKQRLGELDLLSDVNGGKKTSDQRDNVALRALKLKAISMDSLADIQCPSKTSERIFPVLKQSSSEKSLDSYPPSIRPNAIICEKIFKLWPNNKVRTNNSTAENEKTPNEADVEENDGPPLERQSRVTTFCRGENYIPSIFKSFRDRSSSSESFDSLAFTSVLELMELERQERRRNKKKPSKYVLMEKKAMQELKVFYNATLVKDERITICKAHSSAKTSKVFANYLR